jgi:hypothetical protein
MRSEKGFSHIYSRGAGNTKPLEGEFIRPEASQMSLNGLSSTAAVITHGAINR